MKPSEYDPYNWERGGQDRKFVIAALRRLFPAGLGLHERQKGQWLPLAREVLLRHQDNACASCRSEFPAPDEFLPTALEVDHIVPLHANGDHGLGNLQLLCPACHRRKSANERSDPEAQAARDQAWEAKEALRAALAAALTTDPIAARDLAAAHGISTSTATGHLVELQRRGLARRATPFGWVRS